MPGASEHGISVQLDVNAMGKLNALLLFGDTHCLSANNDKGYGGIGCINLACTRVKAARVVVIASVTDNATQYCGAYG